MIYIYIYAIYMLIYIYIWYIYIYIYLFYLEIQAELNPATSRSFAPFTFGLRVLKADPRSPASWPSSGVPGTAKCPFFAISTIRTRLGWDHGWILLVREKSRRRKWCTARQRWGNHGESRGKKWREVVGVFAVSILLWEESTISSHECRNGRGITSCRMLSGKPSEYMWKEGVTFSCVTYVSIWSCYLWTDEAEIAVNRGSLACRVSPLFLYWLDPPIVLLFSINTMKLYEIQWFFFAIYPLVGGLEHQFYFPRNIGFRLSSQLTNSYFSEGVKPPTRSLFHLISHHFDHDSKGHRDP